VISVVFVVVIFLLWLSICAQGKIEVSAKICCGVLQEVNMLATFLPRKALCEHFSLTCRISLSGRMVNA
jgi:hypothetical protein